MSPTVNMMCSTPPRRRSLLIATLEGTLVRPALVDQPDARWPTAGRWRYAGKISTGVVAY
jgi:hypothetical protein